MKISALDRIFLLGASLLAAYQVVVGIEGLSSFTILCYTVGFGVILVACLLMIILGFDVLESPLVVVLSTLIPPQPFHGFAGARGRPTDRERPGL